MIQIKFSTTPNKNQLIAVGMQIAYTAVQTCNFVESAAIVTDDVVEVRLSAEAHLIKYICSAKEPLDEREKRFVRVMDVSELPISKLWISAS